MALITKLINRLTMAINVFGTLLIVALMVLISADVIGRGVFDAPISGVPEMVSLSIVAIVFLQAPQAFRMGRFTRSEAILNWLGQISVRLRAGFEMVFALAGAAIISVLLYASTPLFFKAWNRDTFVGTVGDFIAPVWPVKLIILIGALMLILQFMLLVIKQANVFWRNEVIDELQGNGASL